MLKLHRPPSSRLEAKSIERVEPKKQFGGIPQNR